jgi:hypothetical protein
MNKAIFIALLVGGIILIVFGMNARDSLSSDVSRVFTGAPTNKAIFMLVGGAVAAVIGLIGIVRKPQ